MNPVDALMPNTGTILRHLTRAAAAAPVKGSKFEVQGSTVPQPSTLNPQPSADPSHCKYIILENDQGKLCPIIFDRRLQHRDMVPPNLIPVSAGFVMIIGSAVVVPPIPSTTLNLGPKPEDQRLISTLLNQ